MIGLYNVLCLSIGTQKKIDYLRRSLRDWGWEEGNYKDFLSRDKNVIGETLMTKIWRLFH